VATPPSLAIQVQADRTVLADETAERAARMWRQADPDYLDASWDAIAPALVGVIGGAQVTAAQQSRAFAGELARQYESSGALDIVPEAFAGVDVSGREVGPGMFGAVTLTKSLVGAGVSYEQAFAAGSTYLMAKAKSFVHDAGRQADIAAAGGKGWTRYVRVISPGACSRCAVLAGKAEYKTAFRRHPACRCTACPIEGDGSGPVPAGLYSDPREYFDSLTRAEQERVFTVDGAQAIRDGADVSRVVNARRGMYETRGVVATGEGTTFRSKWARDQNRGYTIGTGDRYRRTKQVRLMPEAIYKFAGDDAALARRLLFDNGYYSYSGLTRTELVRIAGPDTALRDRVLEAAGY
jgi:hypothetical protein